MGYLDILFMKPFILWMTGLPCSGKTTIVKDLQKDIPNLAMLDNKKVAHLAKLLLKHGVPSAVSLVSPYLENRENARKIIDAGDQFAECYVKCSLEKCEERDVKGMYAKARKGEIKGFTGIDDPYEAPEKADLVVDTEHDSLSDSANKVKDFLKGRNLL
jgi:adenylylsulfate kinase